MPEEHQRWEKRIGLADMHGTVATVSYEPSDPIHGEATVFAGLESGAARLSVMATPEALRQWAAALLDAADALQEAAHA